MDETTGEQPRWTLGYEAEGSADAAWTLRHGTGVETVVYETTSQFTPDDADAAQQWAEDYLRKALESREADIEWEPHYPGPGTAADFYTALIDDAP
jgi:hypothetical protein